MNRIRRKELQDILDQMTQLRERLETVMNEEQEAYDNLPDSIQDGGQGIKMSNAIDCMDTALSSMEDIEEALTDAQE